MRGIKDLNHEVAERSEIIKEEHNDVTIDMASNFKTRVTSDSHVVTSCE